jgi:hypothetical protein
MSRSFIWKIIYISLIAVLLIPLYLLGHPATSAARGVQGNRGGVLAQMRTKYRLSEAQLGEIDPGSVTIKLATLGMRGVAANILWEKATDYKMKKDWTNFGATLNQITKVQPNFINVWTNQAWNLSYNISVEFDDYRERYRWVIKGFNFLDEGIKYNKDQPRLQWEMGRMVSQKIGKADEVKQYRRLFAADTDYRDSLPPEIRDTCRDYNGRPDNWLAGKGWYTKSVEMFDELKTPAMGQSPLIYRSSAPMCQMNYAEAVEKDGVFGEVAQKAWADAATDWHHYGGEDIPSSFKWEGSDDPILLHLNDEEAEREIAKQKLAELEKMQPGLREKIIAEKKKALPPAQRLALDAPAAERKGKQFELAAQAEEAIRVTHDEVARRMPLAKRDAAKKLAKEAMQHELLALYTNRYRSTVNFNFWRDHAKTEQGKDLRTARQLIYSGDRDYANGDQADAVSAYREGLQAWRKVLDDHREYLTDQTTNEDLIDMIRRYRRVLAQEEHKTLPEPFILQDVIDVHQREFGGTWNKEEEKPKKDKIPAVNKNAAPKKAIPKKASVRDAK